MLYLRAKKEYNYLIGYLKNLKDKKGVHYALDLSEKLADLKKSKL